MNMFSYAPAGRTIGPGSTALSPSPSFYQGEGSGPRFSAPVTRHATLMERESVSPQRDEARSLSHEFSRLAAFSFS